MAIPLSNYYRLRLMMAGWRGLEPPTSCVTGRRSNQLSYHPMINFALHIQRSEPPACPMSQRTVLTLIIRLESEPRIS